ncbi:phage tail protein [Streptomyces sp. NPDC013178]|uniref:phage tail protein n=1 Tax=Streptomyces sp. NPDC013178 TaxID=3155118 RepID=UPI0033F12D85
MKFASVAAEACHDVHDHGADGPSCKRQREGEYVMDASVVARQCQVELGGLRVEALKSVTAVTDAQEVIDVVPLTLSAKNQWDYVHGPGGKNMMLTRTADRSEEFTRWIQDVRDPAVKPDLVLVFVNAKNEPVKKMSFAQVHPVSWSRLGVTPGGSGVGEETLELRYLDAETKFL